MKSGAPGMWLGTVTFVGALTALTPSIVKADGTPTGVTIQPAQGDSGARAVDDVRQLPVVPEWKPGDPITVRPPMVGRGGSETAPPSGPQPGAEAPATGPETGATVNLTKKLVKNGQGFTGVFPPDTTGAIGANHYIQMINGSQGARVLILDKSGSVAAGPFALGSLFPDSKNPCRTKPFGDGTVNYDYLAKRWFMLEFIDPKVGNQLCLYVSKTSNPVTGGWLAYAIGPLSEFPDYPKLGIWPNAVVITVNDSRLSTFTFDRAAILANSSSIRGVRFTFQRLPAFGFQALTPAHLSSATAPPSGSPVYVMRHRDTEVNGGTAPTGKDLLELFQLQPNYASPASSTKTLSSIRVPDFDSTLCGLSTLNCVRQPGTTERLDGIREVIMQPLQYRKNGSTQSLVGAFSVDGNGADLAAPYWFELRRSSSGWSFREGGKYQPSTTLARWLPSIAMDKRGDIAMGFSTSGASGSNFPSAQITGRLASDPLSTLGGAVTVKAGTGSQTAANRWGDYAAMTVDPADNCTFWFTTEYIPSNHLWKTTIGAYKFPGCS